jgi:hypothetical protein
MARAVKAESPRENMPVRQFLSDRNLLDKAGPLLPDIVVDEHSTIELKPEEVEHLDSMLAHNDGPEIDPFILNAVVLYIRSKINSGRHRKELEELGVVARELRDLRKALQTLMDRVA